MKDEIDVDALARFVAGDGRLCDADRMLIVYQIRELGRARDEAVQAQRAYEHEVMLERNEQHDRLVADRDALRAEVEELRGAMRADDERLRVAAERVWGEHAWGCDAPEHMADLILDLREQLRLASVDAANEAAEANDLRAEVERLRQGITNVAEDAERKGFPGLACGLLLFRDGTISMMAPDPIDTPSAAREGGRTA